MKSIPELERIIRERDLIPSGLISLLRGKTVSDTLQELHCTLFHLNFILFKPPYGKELKIPT